MVKISKVNKINKVIKILKNGGVGVIATDTLFGLVGSTFSSKAVDRIYRLKKRDPKKPLIVLISSFDDLSLFGVSTDLRTKNILKKVWPGPVSVILPCLNKKFSHLHRGAKTVAFRLPKKGILISFLKKSGPLAAPSANPEGLPPAVTIKEAKNYFGKKADFYLPGRVRGKASGLVEIKNGKMIIKRPLFDF